MTIEPKLMSAEDVAEYRRDSDVYREFAPQDIKDLLAHIAAQDQRIVELEATLHKKEEHPNYEYACTHGPRKAWDVTPPPGDGWERNVHAWGYDGGFCRRDYHEEQYWMRKVRP